MHWRTILAAELPNVLSAISVLFAIAVFHMTTNLKNVEKALAFNKPPKEQSSQLDSLRKKIRGTVIFSSLPNFSILVSLLFTMTPLFIKHAKYTTFSFMDMNQIITLYQIIWFVVIVYTISSIANFLKLLRKWLEFRQP